MVMIQVHKCDICDRKTDLSEKTKPPSIEIGVGLDTNDPSPASPNFFRDFFGLDICRRCWKEILTDDVAQMWSIRHKVWPLIIEKLRVLFEQEYGPVKKAEEDSDA